MTILTVIDFFLKESKLAFRPIHVANYLNRPEKTIYRCLSILVREQILSESHGLYFLNPASTRRGDIKPRSGCPLILAVILTVLPGQTFTERELSRFFNKKISRALTRLESSNLVFTAPDTQLFQKSQTNVWLNNSLSMRVAESQSIRTRMEAIYGK